MTDSFVSCTSKLQWNLKCGKMGQAPAASTSAKTFPCCKKVSGFKVDFRSFKMRFSLLSFKRLLLRPAGSSRPSQFRESKATTMEWWYVRGQWLQSKNFASCCCCAKIRKSPKCWLKTRLGKRSKARENSWKQSRGGLQNNKTTPRHSMLTRDQRLSIFLMTMKMRPTTACI